MQDAIQKLKATIEVEVNRKNGALVVFDSLIEISLDCFICQRNRRTIILNYGEESGNCPKEHHEYPAKIVDIKFTNNRAVYYIEYDYHEFEDKQYKCASNNVIRWARVHYKITCPTCNKEKNTATQNNLVRPWSCFCECGRLLYIEKDEQPIISNYTSAT